MIETILSVIDRLIQLLSIKENLNEKQFENILKPLYEGAESIYRDYLKTFDDLETMIYNCVEEEKLIRFLEARRLEYLPVRMKVRAVLSKLRRSPRTGLGKQDRFIEGIWYLMRGGIAISEPGYLVRLGTGKEGLTLLDILYIFLSMPSIEFDREWGMHSVEYQLLCLHDAWQAIVEGYAEKQNAIYSR